MQKHLLQETPLATESTQQLSLQSDKNSEEYGGPEPFSEPQTRLLNNVLEAQPQAFVNLHSGEWAMYTPWDSKQEVAANLPVS